MTVVFLPKMTRFKRKQLLQLYGGTDAERGGGVKEGPVTDYLPVRYYSWDTEIPTKNRRAKKCQSIV